MSDEIQKLLESMGEDAEPLGEFSEEAVNNLERQLQVRLPKSYCAFLRRYGNVGIFGYEFLGLVYGSPKSVPSVLFLTQRLRDTALLPIRYVPILITDEHYYVLDTLDTEGDECKVLEIESAQFMSGECAKVVASSFKIFFIDFVQEERKRRA